MRTITHFLARKGGASTSQRKREQSGARRCTLYPTFIDKADLLRNVEGRGVTYADRRFRSPSALGVTHGKEADRKDDREAQARTAAARDQRRWLRPLPRDAAERRQIVGGQIRVRRPANQVNPWPLADADPSRCPQGRCRRTARPRQRH